MTIYVYYIDICSSIQLPQPHRRQMEKPLGRKRKLSKEEEDNLKECLAVPNVAESRILKIWNIAGHLRKNACEVKQSQMQSLSAERLRDARACYRKWPVPERMKWFGCLAFQRFCNTLWKCLRGTTLSYRLTRLPTACYVPFYIMMM